MSFGNSQNNLQDRDVYQYSTLYSSQTPYRHNYINDQNGVCTEETTFWCNSPRSDSPSPEAGGQHGSIVGPYQIYTPISFATSEHAHYRTSYLASSDGHAQEHIPPPFVRVVKRRNTANKKERRRTQSINNAYSDLRDCIPNVPADTKLSKIKTLRLATSYIAYLTGVLETDDPMGGFRAELGSSSRRSHSHIPQNSDCQQVQPRSPHSEEISTIGGSEGHDRRRGKGRTGWPQHVWALELKNEQSL